MDPITIGSAISAVGSLLGGRAAAREQARLIAQQNEYNRPVNIRARAEEGGFNPLLFVGPGVDTQATAGVPMMGQAISNAALAVSDGMGAKAQADAYAAALEQQNQELRKALDSATLRPEVRGGFVVQPQASALPVAYGAADTWQVDPNETPAIAGFRMGAGNGGFMYDPAVSNADTNETRYGDSELASMLTGAGVLWKDLLYNAKHNPAMLDFYGNAAKGLHDVAPWNWTIKNSVFGAIPPYPPVLSDPESDYWRHQR